MTPRTHPVIAVVLSCASLLAGACAGGAQDSAAGGDGGGNVGFGGAQDLGQFRGILAAGGIPGEQTLDANGFFNEHFTELPPPDCGQTLCLHAMLSVGEAWTSGAYQAALQISLNTPIDPTTLERKPLDLVLVVDVSGSMSADNRLVYVKQGMHRLVDELQPGDRVAIVSYSSEARVLNTFEQALSADALHGLIEDLSPGGATNIYAGLQTGLTLLANGLDSSRQNRVMLLSDGLATAGNTSDVAIIDLAEAYIGDGIGLTTIGVGSDFNVNLMRGLAERGAGNFYFLEDAQAAIEVFSEELDYFVTPIALGVDISVTSTSGYRIGQVDGTRLWKSEGDSGRMFVPAVFVSSRVADDPGPGGRRGGGSALFLRMDATGGVTDPSEIADITLRYRDPVSGEEFTQRITATNPTAPGVLPEAPPYLSADAMAEQYAMYNLFLGLQLAARQADSDYSCAYGTLERVQAEALAWNLEYADEDIAADIELIELFKGNLLEAGADPAWCSDEDDWDTYDDYEQGPYYYGCAVSRGRANDGAWALVLMALALATRRRGTSR